MKKIFILTLLVLALSPIHAQYSQYFLPPLDEGMITMSRDVYVVTNDGDTLYGDRITAATMINGQIRSFNMRQKGDKTKLKFKAITIKVLAVRLTDLMKSMNAMSVPSLLAALDIDWAKFAAREWVIFEKVPLPKKEGKYALMQLLNPDFDSKIKVYERPNSNETATSEINGVQIAGGEDTSYIVVQDGASDIYKKRRYKKDALTLIYKNCDVFVENYSGEKMKWKDFSEHVFIYDRLCGDGNPK